LVGGSVKGGFSVSGFFFDEHLKHPNNPLIESLRAD
jgi:hypothetical protein